MFRASFVTIGLVLFVVGGCTDPDVGSSTAVVKNVQDAGDHSQDFGSHIVFYNTLTTDKLTPEVAQQYGIERSRSRALLNISVAEKLEDGTTKSTPAVVSAEARNLTGTMKALSMKQITEGAAIYYLGDLSITNQEELIFDIKVKPESIEIPYTIKFKQQFFVR